MATNGASKKPLSTQATVLALLAALVSACSNSSGSSRGSDSGPTGSAGQPCSQYTLCTQNGNTFTCDCGGGTSPACPSNVNPSEPCQAPSIAGCMACSQGATLGCSCTDAGPAAVPDAGLLHWECVGGGQACR